MEMFREYLQGLKKYNASTRNSHVQNVGYFMRWVEDNGLDEVENILHKHLLEYVQYEQQRGIDVATINLRLGSVSKYFDYLKTENVVSRNPAKTLRIKGSMKRVTEQPLSYEQLELLYHDYKLLQRPVAKNIERAVRLAHERNVIVVGLLIWQGLHSGELERLEVEHVKLSEGKIYIPSTARSNSRELRLHPGQILSLHSYVNGGVRDMLKTKGDKLFGVRCHDIVQYVLEELKGINGQVRNARHIRASVILYWLKQYHKRQVQYMAGHKYIDSTERYAVQETDSLKDLLSRHHPFG